MNEHLAWVQWWAYAWMSRRTDWLPVNPGKTSQQSIESISRSHHLLLSKQFGVEPCSPPQPQPTLLRLVLASPQQQALILALIETVCHPVIDHKLNDEQHIWCQRLAKAMHPEQWLENDQDPLKLLQAWVAPAIWQRLRLRFPRQRILAIEQTRDQSMPRIKLDALWQAVIWRANHAPGPQGSVI